ncbi:MAG: hypothetical protein HZR80_02190 [Candidatus Heimdallarchaeota archaeon]
MSVINWQNDSLLLDPDNLPQNEWVTANKLLEVGQGERIFANCETLTLQLYPVLVHRIDFLRDKASNRILSRFPFLVLTAEEKELIKNKILLIAEFAWDYFYKSFNSGLEEKITDLS